MENQVGFKELYDVTLKATYPIEIGDQKINAGEVVAVFDKIQIANFDEINKYVAANGGHDNRALIWWEDTKEIRIGFVQGVFSTKQLAIMTNAKMVASNDEKPVIGIRQILESDESGMLHTKHPVLEPVFVYDVKTGEKIIPKNIENSTITLEEPYKEVVVDYNYVYIGKYNVITFGRELTNGFLSLEGKMRVKDDITGQVTTGIIKIPKLKLLSNLSMRLGQDAIPHTGRLNAVAVPTGARGQKRVMEFIFLDDDIDSDI